ncbi:uncharacterized protein LOC141692937 [Apium graveolens]|uniref:uncharacterized protein LOC141692937 n=1 Tax=Apium graveolens TaxID=4045 RepID=UPI003D78DBF7
MDAVKLKKGVIFCVGTCYRSVCKHPFFLGMVIFMIFMYRSFPFLFSFLVSASPVIVSTAVLLGTLLSFGQPNIPEFEKEEINHEISSLRTGGGLDHTVVERDGSYRVEKYTESRSDVDKSVEEVSLTANDFSDVGKNDGLAESAPLIEEDSREFQFQKWETHGESDSCDVVFGHKNEEREGDGEVLANVYTPVQQTVDEFENVKLFEAYVCAETVDRTSPLGSPRKHEDENEEHEYDDDDSDSESDGAESSSPDASMADILPLLDELHPLLDEDVPQHARMPLEGSDDTSESSSESSSGEDNELDDDIENHENELEVVDDEEEQEGHEDKSAIRWTEVDQKNLMDLGTSELERNKRLESLIARRRLRKSMKMMTEKNLIDFDSVDLPFSIAHISTARRNPFDLPYDDDMGLPPIPGSAPSIMSQRRNPFDLPYDSSEEKPDLMGDDFQHDVMTLQSKEPVFRRNETFNVGPSLFGTSRHESKFKPYFIPERMTSEGTSYSSFHRQSSDLSESKASSVPETESITSDEDLEDKKPIEEDLEHGKLFEEDLVHKKPIEEDLVNETELISITEPELGSIPEHPSEGVGHGSDSSEDEDPQGKRDNVKDEYEAKLLDVEDCRDMSSFFATTATATSVEPNTNEVHRNTEALELKSQSSSSSSEVNGDIYAENEDELLFSSEPLRGDSNEDFTIVHQPSMENSDTEITKKLVDDTQHKEPLYDSTPRGLKDISSPSVHFDSQVEQSKTTSPPSLVPRMISFSQKDYEVNDQEIVGNPVDEVVEELVVLHQPPSEEHMAQSEKGLPLSDQSVNEPSPRNPEELQESTNLIDLNFQGSDNIHQDIDPPKTFEPTSMQAEAKEIEAPEAGLYDDILERVGFDEIIHVVEHDMFPIEADTHTNMEDNVEDLDDIEGIDEGLLHELDTVGDFSIKDVRSDFNESGGQSFHMIHNISNSSKDLENNDDCSGVILSDEQSFRALGVEKEPSSSEEERINASTFQISETNFGEHLNASSREIVQVEALILSDSDKTNDRPLPEETATELSDLNIMLNPNAREMNSEISAVEVQAIHDNEFSYKEAVPMLEEMYVGFGDPAEILHQDSLHVTTEVGMPVLEARSLDDIRSGLGQLDANGSEKQHPAYRLDSEKIKPPREETATELADSNIMQNSNAGEINSGIPVVEVQAIYDNEFSYKDAEPMSENMNVKFGESEILTQDPLHVKTAVGMPVLEAHSLDDIRLALAQVDAKGSEKQYAVDLVHMNLSPSENLDGYSQHEMVDEDSILPESKSNLTLLESNFVNDEKSALELQKDLSHAETEVVMPVLEPCSLDEIESDIDHINGTDSEKQYAINLVDANLSPDETVGDYSQHEMLHEGLVPLESKVKTTVSNATLSPDETVDKYPQHEMLHEGLVPPESKSDVTVLESKLVQDRQSAVAQQHGESVDRHNPRGSDGDDIDSAESNDPAETLSSVHVDEARSNTDIDAAAVHMSSADIEKLPIANFEIGSVDPMINELQSSKAIESSSGVSGVVESNSEIAEKLPKEAETEKDSKIPIVEHKKTKSRKSSSSSSSSSSDSDRE